MFRSVVFSFVDTHNDGFDFTFAGSGNDNFLGTSSDVGFRLFAVSEEASGFNDDVHAESFPREGGEIFYGANAFDLVAVDDKQVGFFERRGALFSGDGVFEFAMDGVILHLVSEVFRVRRHVHDGDDVN